MMDSKRRLTVEKRQGDDIILFGEITFSEKPGKSKHDKMLGLMMWLVALKLADECIHYPCPSAPLSF